MSDVLFEIRNQLGIITLNRATALNALTLEMVRAITAQLLTWKTAPEVRAVVIQSTSEKAFCAGGDIRQIFEAGKKGEASHFDFFREEYAMNALIHHYPKPYIALMNGVTMGGGVGVSLHGSHPVGSEKFLFAMPETGIGFFPDIGASFLLSRIPHHIGEYLALTGARLGTQDAFYCGLLKYIVPSAAFSELLDALINSDLSEDSTGQVHACIQHFAIQFQNASSDNSVEKNAPIIENLEILNHCFSHDRVEDMIQALSQNPNPWTLDVLHKLSQKSPLSLKVTLSQIRRANGLSLEECLEMDYTLVQHFMAGHDFYEGVRALLVDKDKSPQWSPVNLSEVDEQMVVNYFFS